MKKFLLAAALWAAFSLGCASAFAQNRPPENFNGYVAGLPLASSVNPSSDYFYLLQGGLFSKKVTAGAAITALAPVASVANSDGTLIIGPTVGSVVASVNLNHANNWPAVQTFPNGSLTAAELASGAAASNVGSIGGALSGTLPNPALASGAAASNVGGLGGALGGTLPNPSLAAGAAASNVGGLGGALGGTLPNPSLAAGAAASNVGGLGGALGGTLPNPSMAAGAAASNVGSLGGDLSGTLPNPTVATVKGKPVRVTLSANADYYTNTSTGNDANACLVGAPCKTLNHTWDYLATTLDPGPYKVTIHVAAGSYPLQITNGNAFISGNEIDILGAGSASTTIVDFDMAGNHPVTLAMDNVKFIDDAASLHNSVFFTNGLATFGLGFVGSDDLIFDTTANSTSFGINPTNHTDVFINSLTAKGNANQLLNPADHGTSIAVYGTVTFSGSPAYSVGVAQVFEGTLGFYGSFTGTVTGPKYQIGDLGTITNASGSAFAGSVEGQVFETGTYEGPDANVIFTPSSGGTVTMVNLKAIIKPAGTLATLTVNLPVTNTAPGNLWFPNNNATVVISTTQTLTALTVATTDGTTLINPPTTLAAGHAFKLIYDHATTTWYPTD